MSTTAEIFANYLSLTPENAPWAYFSDLCPRCNGWCNVYIGLVPSRCPVCKGPGKEYQFTATSPLAEKPTPGWCEALILGSDSLVLYGPSAGDPGCVARLNGELRTDGHHTHPTRAVALALLAADPDLRARCEQASDWEAVK